MKRDPCGFIRDLLATVFLQLRPREVRRRRSVKSGTVGNHHSHQNSGQIFSRISMQDVNDSKRGSIMKNKFFPRSFSGSEKM